MHLSHYVAAGLSHNHLTGAIKLIKQERIERKLNNKPKMKTYAYRIMLIVSECYNLSIDELTGKCQDAKHKIARHIAIHIVRQKTDLTLKNIGELFNRNYTTVIHSCQTIDNYCRYDKQFEKEYLNVLELTNV
jgi:chromosomal replication initiation ATPase DnaA